MVFSRYRFLESFAAMCNPIGYVSLSHLHKGQRGTVVCVDGTKTVSGSLLHQACRRLIELGFVAGERVEVLAEAFPGRDPLAVRIGGSCFALRRVEANLIRITPDPV